MMLNIRVIEIKEIYLKYIPVSFLILLAFAIEITYLITLNISKFNIKLNILNWLDAANAITNIETLGYFLYMQYYHIIILCGFILLVAMVGSIVLTLKVQKSD